MHANLVAANNPWFAENLRWLMKQRGLNIARLSRWVGVSRQGVHQWCQDKHPPTNENFDRLCGALQCTPNDLLKKHGRRDDDWLTLAAWAQRENIPLVRARDLFNLRLLTGERRTPYVMLVPAGLQAPPDSKNLVMMAKVRPRWVPFFHANFPRLLESIEGVYKRKSPMIAVSEAVGVKPQAVSHWATGRKYPERERLPIIAEVLGVSMRELVGDVRL